MAAAIPPDGAVEVSYPEEIARKDPSPFLPEEWRLIEKVAAEISLAVGRIRAATEKARLEAQLRHADRLATIGVLAAGVAHELNEPLVSVLGFAQLVEKAPGLPRQASLDLARIVDACLRAREIVQKLLVFGRNAPARVEDCDLNEIVEDGLRFLEPRAKREGIELVRELAPGLPPLSADPTQINQVLVNLVVNAIQAMPGGGHITVASVREGGFLRLTVRDEGIGMSPETVEKIFVPFFTTKGTGGGTGLGLPVVHGIVFSLGGDIVVQSELGKGSRFDARFPLEAGANSVREAVR
jgi:two-component system NtrC family sensor kinase